MSRYPALLLDVKLMAIGYWWVALGTCQDSFQRRVLWRLRSLTTCGVITSLLWVGPAVFALPLCLPPPSVCSYQCICCQKREEAGEGKGESDGERNNISIPSSLRNLSRSESNPATAELHCIKGVSRVADTTRRPHDGIILAKSDSTGPVPASTFAA